MRVGDDLYRTSVDAIDDTELTVDRNRRARTGICVAVVLVNCRRPLVVLRNNAEPIRVSGGGVERVHAAVVTATNIDVPLVGRWVEISNILVFIRCIEYFGACAGSVGDKVAGALRVKCAVEICRRIDSSTGPKRGAGELIE